MKKINEINILDIKVGEKVSFLYPNSNKEKKQDDTKIKVTLTDSYFHSIIDKFVKNYESRYLKNETIRHDLQEEYKTLEEIKGKYDKKSKEIREEVKTKMDEYFSLSSGGVEEIRDDVIFWKRFTMDKGAEVENCHVEEVYYIGSLLDRKNGNYYEGFISQSGYVDKENEGNLKEKNIIE